MYVTPVLWLCKANKLNIWTLMSFLRWAGFKFHICYIEYCFFSPQFPVNYLLSVKKGNPTK